MKGGVAGYTKIANEDFQQTCSVKPAKQAYFFGLSTDRELGWVKEGFQGRGWCVKIGEGEGEGWKNIAFS